MRRVAILALIFASALVAQQTPAPAFYVVSIRVVPPNTPPTSRDQYFSPILPGGEYIDSRTNLMVLICFAYNCKNPDKQMLGLPNWAKNQSYAIAAKPEDGFAVRSTRRISRTIAPHDACGAGGPVPFAIAHRNPPGGHL